jgi:hypothetical protein
MPRPVCVPCARFYRPQKNGFRLTEGMPNYNGATPGLEGSWRPYKLWIADKWRCPDCGHEIVVGFANDPVAIQHEPNFEQTRTEGGFDKFQVNDC